MPKITVDGFAWVLLAFGLLVLPLEWLAAIVFSASFHELCHMLSAAAFGGKIRSVGIRLGGAVMEAEDLSAVGALVSILAGPAGSIFLALCCRHFPRVAFCALAQGCFNLIPVYPLDGGRILELILSGAGNVCLARGIRRIVTAAFLIGGAITCLYIRFPGAVLVLIPLLWEKYLAKRREKGYNRTTKSKG